MAETLFATIIDGRLLPGPRSKNNRSAIYYFPDTLRWKAIQYSIWSPIWEEDVFVRFTWEFRTNANDRISAQVRTDQKLARERSTVLYALHVEFFPCEVDDLDGCIDFGSMLLKALKVRGIIKKEVPKVVVQGCRALNGESEGTKEVLEV
jgi:hypothetical protein